jgi:short-subunit dehydrogenase
LWLLWAILLVAMLLGLVELVLLGAHAAHGFWKYWLLNELDLPARYGPGSWVLITGASSGMGAEFARKFAQRGFHLLLVGSARTKAVIAELRRRHPLIEMRLVVRDFGRAFDEGFFDPIEREVARLGGRLSILVNNVAQRAGSWPYHVMSVKAMRASIACGTLVQARLTHMVLPHMLQRPSGRRSAIVCVAAQALHPTFALGLAISPQITLPGLSVYEGANAFGLYHAASVSEEYLADPRYRERLDFLTVTPGAVRTSNTSEFLADTMFAVEVGPFIDNVFRLLGNVQGTTAAAPGHAMSMFLMSLAPWMKRPVLDKTGRTIALACMRPSKSYTPPAHASPMKATSPVKAASAVKAVSPSK